MKSKKKIIFRADAGIDIGYGHFIRSLALANMLKDDFDCTIATQTPNSYQIKEASTVCSLIKLPADETKFAQFIEMLSGDEIVVLDNYFYTTAYQKDIRKKGCKLVCIDDIHDKHYVADILINHGLDDKSKFSVEPYTNLCLGINWALLREAFLEALSFKKEDKQNIENVVVSFGGVDAYNLTDKTINKICQQNPTIKIDAIVGNHYTSTIKNKNINLNIHQNISAEEVASLFKKADLAIVSASTICFEALACKTTIAAGFYVDNQVEIYHYLLKEKHIIGLGNLLENEIDIKLNPFTQHTDKKYLSEKLSDIKKNYITIFKSL